MVKRASQVVLVTENPPANAGDTGDVGSIPVSGRSPGGENGNPLQRSHLQNTMDRGSWQATVYGGTKCQTRLSNWTCTYMYIVDVQHVNVWYILSKQYMHNISEIKHPTHTTYLTLVNANSGCTIWTATTSLILTSDIFQILDFERCTVECRNNHHLGNWKVACQNWNNECCSRCSVKILSN